MNERIRQLRTMLKMSQEEFGKLLGITKSGVSDIESGRRKVTNQHLIMLSRHGVNEDWLRTGEGEMFIEMSRDEEIAGWVGRILSDESAEFKRRVIGALSRMNESGWDELEKFLNDLQNNKS